MPRFCTHCGEPLTPEHHSVLVNDETGEPEKKWIVVRRGRGRLGLQKVTVYGCKVRLIATSPVTGKTLVASYPQRINETDTRYVHSRRFEPGKDLNPK